MRTDTTSSASPVTGCAGSPPCSEQISPLPPSALRRWIAHADPGERLAYHRGCLTRDRAPGTPLRDADRARLDALAAAALQAAQAGRVHLVQRRQGPFDFSYLAIRAALGRRARPAAVPTGDGVGARRPTPCLETA